MENANSNTNTMIAGDNVFIQSLDPTQQSTLTNAGTIAGNKQVVITTDQINNATASIGGKRATISAGNQLYINTINNTRGTAGKVNNIGGLITSTDETSIVYIKTGDLNNITLAQQEEVSHSAKGYKYERTDSYVGTTAEINSGGSIISDVENNLTMIGSNIAAKNGNVDLNVKGDMIATTLQVYNREYQYQKRKHGAMSTKITQEDETWVVRNISSNITAGNDIDIKAQNLISVGTNFEAENDINVNVVNNLMLFYAMDKDYAYHYYKEEKFDVASAITSVVVAAAAAALTVATGGAGGVVIAAAAGTAGATSMVGASQMTKGSIDITMKYDETTVGTTLTAGNDINLKSGKDTTMVSTQINAANGLNIETGGNLFIGTAQEQHIDFESHETFGGDIGKAAIGGAITGIATGLSFGAGQALGNLASNAVSSVAAGSISTATGATSKCGLYKRTANYGFWNSSRAGNDRI